VKSGLTLALPKGRLLDPAIELLRELGVSAVDPESRKLIFKDPGRGLEILLLKPADVPAYVTYGAADLGIVGRDILLEQEPDVYEPLDLGFGFCRLVVAEPRELWERDDPAKWSWVRVASKYPRLTEQYFSSRGIQVEIVRLDGSIELAPLVGLAERIVDLVQSGETLRANGLVEVAEITRSTARVIVNRASMKTEYAAVTQLISEMRARVGRPCACARSMPASSASTPSSPPSTGRPHRSPPRSSWPWTRSWRRSAPAATPRSSSTPSGSTGIAPAARVIWRFRARRSPTLRPLSTSRHARRSSMPPTGSSATTRRPCPNHGG
jgi:ATP phosphoribosyltransferase